MYQFEIDTIVQGIELSWVTWSKMRGERLVRGDISYLRAEGEGFERIFSVDIKDDAELRIQQMVSSIKTGEMPDSMLITPSTRPEDLAQRLSGQGFIITGGEPCMMMYLDDFQAQAAEPDGFRVCDVTDGQQLSDWLAIVSKALFGGELVTADQFSDVMALDNTCLYLGMSDGVPAAACMTIRDGDTSVLEMVATLSQYRRRGFASAVINRAVLDLREKGIKTISLRAEADGVGVYQRLGFKSCFQRVVARYDWESAKNNA